MAALLTTLLPFTRIACHFCGARSPHAKLSAPPPSFQCPSCEAINHLDAAGHILDTPHDTTTTSSPSPSHQPTKPPTASTSSDQQQIFCSTCQHNQAVYTSSLANYLPPETHPSYAAYERALPAWRAALEKRYPQICKACAPKAQARINRADYFSVTDNLNKAHLRERRRGGRGRGFDGEGASRDGWGKRGMRGVLGALGAVRGGCVVGQVGWHLGGVREGVFGDRGGEGLVFGEEEEEAVQATVRGCLAGLGRGRVESDCWDLLGAWVPAMLLVNLCLIWYNHGLRAYYNPMVRYDRITGQTQHFWIQFMVMAVRTGAYLGLSDESRLSQMKWSQIVAVHCATTAVILGGQWLSRRSIQIHKWRLNNKMMPKPEDQDVLGQYAGPAMEKHTPQASTKLPFDIHAKKHKEPFPISSLAPQRSAYGSHVYTRQSGGPPPSPQGSDSTIEDPMDLDFTSPAQPQSRMPGAPDTRTYNPYAATASGRQQREAPAASRRFGEPSPKGWEDMRSNLFSIEDDMRAQTERSKLIAAQNAAKLAYNPPAEQSPFRGRLPQAPMSMERRLRNPVSQVPSFKEPPVTQQKNFLEQMRAGIDKGKPFNRTNARSTATATDPSTPSRRRSARLAAAADDDDDAHSVLSDFSPAAARTRGNLDLRPSAWHLPADAAAQATGLEDLFGGSSFRISESPELMPEEGREREVPVGLLWTMAATVVLVVLGTVVWRVQGLRRWVFLGIYDWVVRIGL